MEPGTVAEAVDAVAGQAAAVRRLGEVVLSHLGDPLLVGWLEARSDGLGLLPADHASPPDGELRLLRCEDLDDWIEHVRHLQDGLGAIAGQLRWLPEAERAGARSVMDGAWRDLAMAVGVWNGARSAV